MQYIKGDFITVPNKSALIGKKPHLVATFFWLCSFADENGACFPAYKTIAKYSGIHKRTVIRNVAELVEMGMLKKTARLNNDENSSNYYQILLTGVEKTSPSGTQTPDIVVHSCLGSGTQSPITISKELYPIELYPHNYSERVFFEKNQQSFEIFWKEYPKRMAKSQAIKAWKKLNPSDELQKKILKDIQKRKKTDSWLKNNGQFIPYPATYINNARWEDEIKTTTKNSNFINNREVYVEDQDTD